MTYCKTLNNELIKVNLILDLFIINDVLKIILLIKEQPILIDEILIDINGNIVGVLKKDILTELNSSYKHINNVLPNILR